ncbi:hypothetical protein BX661DRAFT_183076 [Kickxella alabastrina]|uniref:uncharacterized protein n=1 Tax=Kickxella alabastrina TaxID=61397 RepID=UPI0022211577|nr:uncharacterized protein BX661DRAFT_183076 [Kickxella alabastrina]KAI7827332.1 hypothetical protein BX661DRAFT_183076 [Kickxella alabastrina]
MASSLPSEQLSGQQAQILPHQHHQLHTPKSAPPKCQTQLRLTSPEAARRSRQSLEAIHVARTLKDGLNRLKERADPQHLLSGGTPRPLRTYSATSTPVQRRRSNQLVRHHSSFQNSLEQQRTTINSMCFVDGGRREPPPRFALDSPGEWRPRRAAEAAETMILFKSQSQSSGMSVDLSEDVSPSPEALGCRGGLPASASASVYESATAIGAGSGSGRVMLQPNRVRAGSASRPTKRASLDR